MLRQPNTDGIKKAAQDKRDRTVERVETAIKQLIKEKREISFVTVAEAAGVSRAWLYNNEAIRARIEGLREQFHSKKAVPSKLKPTEASKTTIIEALRQRVKKLEIENRGLRDQIEVVYGLADPELVKTVSDQQREIEELTKQNQKLMKLLTETRAELNDLKNKDTSR